jgi:hypothetical protein
MGQYEATVTPQSGSIVDGDMRRIAKVVLLHYEKPTSKPRKAGSEIVRAWTAIGLRRNAQQAIDDLMHRDQTKRRADIMGKIERIESKVSLTKKEKPTCETL